MSLSVRYFLFEKDGTIRHIPKRVIEGLHGGRDSLPQYAGQAGVPDKQVRHIQAHLGPLPA